MVYATRDSFTGTSRSVKTQTSVIREVVGVFKSVEDMQNCIRELEGTAFPRQDLSVMGSRGDLEHIFGAKTVRPDFAIDNADTPRKAPSRPEEQTIGIAGMIGGSAYVGAMAFALSAGAVSMPILIASVVIGGLAGGALGLGVAKLLGSRYKRHMGEQIEKGGLLLWVRAPDADKQDTAKRIMIRHNGYDVHTHKIL